MSAAAIDSSQTNSIYHTVSKPLLEYPKLFSFVLGALLPFGFAPYGFYVLSLLSVFGIIFIWRKQTPKNASKSGFIFGFAAFLFGAYWVTISVGTFGGAPTWLAMIVMLGLVALMASYFALLAYLIAKYSQIITSNLMWAFTIASLWTLMEWFRSWVLTGFPWLNLGYLSLDTPLAGYAPLGGVYFCTFLWVLFITFILNFNRVDKTQKIITIGFILVTVFFGGLFNKHSYTQDYQAAKSLALIQGGVSQDKKWLPQQFPITTELYAKLTVENSDADILVWPEAAIPRFRSEVLPYYAGIKARLGANTDFLVGGLERRFDSQGERQDFNSLFLVDDKFNGPEEQLYFKSHLVPYGEYFPLPEFVRQWLCRMGLPCNNLTAGAKTQKPISVNGIKYGVFICYEDAYTDRVNAMLPEANILVNVTNDAWFGGSMAPHQHLQVTRMRALETERPILRATNNGITALIDKKGKVVKTVEQFKPQVLRGTVQGVKGATPFVMLGNWMIVGICFGFLIIIRLLYRKSN